METKQQTSIKFKTISAYVSGSICGNMWMPGVLGGIPINKDLHRQFGRYSNKAGASFRDALISILNENGGDFQNPRYSADTVIRVERRSVESAGKYTVHIYERELSQIADCDDLVNADAYTGDFLGEE